MSMFDDDYNKIEDCAAALWAFGFYDFDHAVQKWPYVDNHIKDQFREKVRLVLKIYHD